MLPKIITIIFFAVIVCLIYNQLQITKHINNLTNSVKVINKKLSKRKKDKKQLKSDNLCNFKQMSKNKCYITSNQEDNFSNSDDIDSNVIEQLELQTSESEISNQMKQINNDLIKTEDIKGQGQISLSLINNDENGKSNTTIPIKLGNVVTAIFNKNQHIDLTQSECIFNDDIITNLINKVNTNPITVSHNDPRVEILSDNQTSEDINKLLNSELNKSNDELISNILKHSDEKHSDETHIDNHLNNQSDEIQLEDNQSDEIQLEDNQVNHHTDNHSDEIKLEDKIDNYLGNHSEENQLADNHSDNQLDSHSDSHSNNHSDGHQLVNNQLVGNQMDIQMGNQMDIQTGYQTDNQISNKTKNKYNEKDLLKKSLIDIKEIAKELKIQISLNGRPKNKKDLINDILKCNV